MYFLSWLCQTMKTDHNDKMYRFLPAVPRRSRCFLILVNKVFIIPDPWSDKTGYRLALKTYTRTIVSKTFKCVRRSNLAKPRWYSTACAHVSDWTVDFQITFSRLLWTTINLESLLTIYMKYIVIYIFFIDSLYFFSILSLLKLSHRGLLKLFLSSVLYILFLFI